MPNFTTFTLTGLSLLLISFLSLSPHHHHIPLFLLSTTLSLLSLLTSLPSLLHPSHSPFSLPLSLSHLSLSSLFLLHSLSSLTHSLPPPLLHLTLSFAFSLLFLHFSLRPKDPDNIENRYFDYALLPILLCSFSSFLSSLRPASAPFRIARAAGLALLGTWFVQMGFSFFTESVASGCGLHRRSWVDYTVKCKTHEDYHRGRAVAALQFNCHLGLVVVVGVVGYGVWAGRRGKGYGVLVGKEMEEMRDSRNFVLVEDDDEDEEIQVADMGVNGGVHSSSQ